MNKISIRIAASLILILCLIVIATFQFYWIGELSSAQVLQMKKNTERSLGLLTQEADKIFTELYNTFQFPLARNREEAIKLTAAALQHWKQNAPRSEILSKIYYAEFSNNALDFYEFDQAGNVNPLASPTPLIQKHYQDIVQLFTKQFTIEMDSYCSISLDLLPIPVFLLDVNDRRIPPQFARALILMETNSEYIKEVLFPSLKNEFLPDDDLDLSVFSNSTFSSPYYHSNSALNTSLPYDLTAGFGALRVNSNFTGIGKGIQPSGIQLNSVLSLKHIATRLQSLKHSNTPGKKNNISFDYTISFADSSTRDSSISINSFVIPSGGNALLSNSFDSLSPKSLVIKTFYSQDSPKWEMRVRHREGSFELAATAFQRRNLAVSFFVLTLLALSVGLLVISAERAQNLAKQQMEFVAGVSHELRTPLAVIQSAGENLADGVINDRENTSRYGELIKSEGKRLSEMVEEILEFAGVESGKKSYRFEAVDIRPVLLEIITEFSTLAASENIRFDYQLPESMKPLLLDRKSFRSALMNLLLNALKYSGGKSPITLTISESHSMTTFSVLDCGIGIHKDDLENIFEPFYRAKSVRVAQIKGNGLGLSLVKRIMEAHKGKVLVESEIRKGSKFTLQFPNG